MLLIVNYNDYMFRGYKWESAAYSTIISDECYIWDTDDLTVECIKRSELIDLMYNNIVSIRNAYITTNFNLGLYQGRQDILAYKEEVSTLDGSVKYRLSGVDYYQGNIIPKGHIIINGKDISFSIVRKEGNEARSQFAINDVRYFDMMSMPGAVAGAAYFFKLDNYIVIQCIIVSLIVHCITLVYTMTGDLIDIFSRDTEFFGDINFQSKDIKFRMKYLMLMKGKY